MNTPSNDPLKTARRYLADAGEVLEQIGAGTDGIVYSTAGPSVSTVLKVFRRQALYQQELAAYQRLAHFKVSSIEGHAVPVLLGYDDSLLVIEMSFVKPPYVLDFAKTEIGSSQFTEEQLEEALADARERFEDHWPKAQSIYFTLRYRYQIFYNDLKPQNIAFAGTP